MWTSIIPGAQTAARPAHQHRTCCGFASVQPSQTLSQGTRGLPPTCAASTLPPRTTPSGPSPPDPTPATNNPFASSQPRPPSSQPWPSSSSSSRSATPNTLSMDLFKPGWSKLSSPSQSGSSSQQQPPPSAFELLHRAEEAGAAAAAAAAAADQAALTAAERSAVEPAPEPSITATEEGPQTAISNANTHQPALTAASSSAGIGSPITSSTSNSTPTTRRPPTTAPASGTSTGHNSQSASSVSSPAMPERPPAMPERWESVRSPTTDLQQQQGPSTTPVVPPAESSSPPDLPALFSRPQAVVQQMSLEQYISTLTLVTRTSVPPGVLDTLSRHLPNVCAALDASQLSQVLFTFSATKVPLPAATMSLLMRRAHSLLSQEAFSPSLCSSFLSSCVKQMDLAAGRKSKRQARDMHLMVKIRARVVGLCAKTLMSHLPDSLSPSCLARSLWALSRLGRCPAELLEAAVLVLAETAGQLPVRERCLVLNALRLSRHSSPELLAALVDSLAAQSESLNASDLNACLQACALFNMHPGEEQLGALCNQLQRLAGELRERDCCGALWCLGLLGEVRRPAFGALWEQLQVLSAQRPLSGVDARQACQAHLSARLQGMVLPTRADMLRDIQTAWKAQVLQSEGGGSTATYLSALLRRLRVRHELRRLTREGLSSIHLALQPSGERFVALQLLGAADTAANTGQLLGPALWARGLLEYQGWQVQLLKVSDLKSIAAPLQPLFMAELCTSLGFSLTLPTPQDTSQWPEVQQWQAGTWDQPAAGAPGSTAQRGAARHGAGKGAERESNRATRGFLGGGNARWVQEWGERNGSRQELGLESESSGDSLSATEQGDDMRTARVRRGRPAAGSPPQQGQRAQQGDEQDAQRAQQLDVAALLEEDDFVEKLTRQLQAQQEPDLLSDLVEEDRQAREMRAEKQRRQRLRKMQR